MGRFWKLARACTVLACALLTVVGVTAAPASAGAAQVTTVSAAPRVGTPEVLDNRVLDFAEAGGRIVVAGDFTQVRDAAANGGATFAQRSVFAYDPVSGAIDRSFVPAVNGVVNAVLAGPDNTVYLGGTFSSVNGSSARNLVQVSLATGERIGAFVPSGINGAVYDLESSGGRLFVGGTFDSVQSAPHGGLAALNPTTGAVDEYLGVDVSVNHNWYEGSEGSRGAVGVRDLAMSPDGSRLVAIGNFTLADGLVRDQVVSVLLQPGQAVVDPDWRTRRYEAACFSWAYDFYVREVDFAPDSSYFVIVTTGGHNVGTLCDTAARWDVADTGDDVQPRWAADAGGDTLHSVAVTGGAVYVGGHQRWMNNTLGNDSPGPGAVPRPGLAALDPRTGVPLAWNPGRHPRGIGAEALLATANGLYVGSDTEYIGARDHRRPRLAYFPLAGAAGLPSEDSGTLPANVFLGGRTTPTGGGTDNRQVLHRINAGGAAIAALDGGPGWAADTGAMRNTGSNSASYPAGSAAVDGSVPSTTPFQVFDTERWDPGTEPEMQWALPVAAGMTVEVRLYLANRCTCTDQPGARVFDVDLEGATVLDDYDITADVGHDVGTMKSFTVTSDGTVDLLFRHVIENPLVNAIEILEAGDEPAPVEAGIDDLVARWVDGAAIGADTEVGAGGLEWSRVRGAFMAGDTLFYGYPTDSGTYSLFRRTFDGVGFGEPTVLDPYNDPAWSDVDTGSGQTFRGTRSAFYNQLSTVSGMFLGDGRLYYTRTGSPALYWRGFSVDSGIVGVDEFVTVPSGFAEVSGLFLSGDSLYGASRTTGDLMRVPFAGGTVTGAPTVVSGPSVDGRSWATRALFLGPGEGPPAPNQTPVADFSFDCVGTTCGFDGSGSSDQDGQVSGWEWDLGDGTTASGSSVRHTFDDGGEYQVGLRVTDDDGATSTVTQTVVVDATAPVAGIALRGSVGTTARPVRAISVQVPDAVQAGDGLVLVLSVNSGLTGTVPAGWELAATQTDRSKVTTQVFSRVASAGDAGSTVTVDVPGEVSSALGLQLLAYSGTSTSGPIASVTGAATGSGTSHTTPVMQAESGSLVVSVWSDKQAAAREFTAPGGVEVRSSLAGAGNGDVATLVADSGAPVPAGQVGGLTATVPTSSSRSTAMTVVLAPGSTAPPVDAVPEAVISSSCAELTCEFDGSGSTDGEGAVASFAWEFGDGVSGSGAVVEHTFAAAGDYEVALAVTDSAGQVSRQTATVTVAAAPTVGAGIGLRGSAGTAARPVRAISVDVPDAVQAGDGLVLVLSVNSGLTGTVPVGWELAGSATDGGQMTTQVFARVATAEDAGSTVTVDVGGSSSSALTLQLMAYSGTSAEGPVASVTGAGGGRGLTAHTTPTADAAAGSWVLSVWSDKAPHERLWVPPAELAERSNIAGAGNGDVATLVADSGAPVPAGQVGGLTATVATASSRATTLTVVLAAAG